MTDLPDYRTDAPTSEMGHGGLYLPPWSAFGGGMNAGGVGLDQEDVPALRWPNNLAVYDRMRTDGQIDALIRSVAMPVMSLKWWINPNGARDEVVEKASTDLNLPIKGADPDATIKRGRKRFNHKEHLRLALLAPCAYGHMAFEQVGRIDDDLFWRLTKLAPRMPRSIAKINVARDGGLESIVQWDGAKMNPDPIPVERLVFYAWEKEGANWTGRSLLRPLYKHWLIKDRMLRVDAIKNERFGAGIPTGTAPEGGDPADYQKLAGAIRAAENAGVGLPAGGTIGIEGVRGTLPDTLATIRYHDEQMARTFLAMFIQLGTTETGSRALGESMIDFFEDSLKAFAEWYAGTTNEHVIEDYVDWNWGPDEQAPLLEWVEDEKAPLSAAELGELVKTGALVMDNELQGWVRNRIGAPAFTGDVPAPQAAPAVAVAASRDDAPERVEVHVHAHGGDSHDQASHGNRHAVEDDEPADPPKAATVAFHAESGGGHVRVLRVPQAASQTVASPKVGHREPTEVETAAGTDFETLQQQWQDAADRLVSAWGPIRDQQVAQLLDLISAAVDAGDATALANIQADVLGSDVILSHLVTMAQSAARDAVAEAAAQGVTVEMPTLETLTAALQSRADATATLLARSISESAARQALNRYGVDAASGADVAQGVGEHLAALSSAYLNDQLGGALTGAQNAGRFASMGGASGVTHFYASELLDQNTCEECAGVDGTEYGTLEDASVDYPSGGYVDCAGGPRCRGTVVAVYGEEQG